MSDNSYQGNSVQEARRQIKICNACRYCEGYCAVFPALHLQRSFAGGDIMQLANLCHNCRSCYYACQYTEPHEFALNLPQALAEVRRDSWKQFACPRAFATIFDRAAMAVVLTLVLGIAFLFWLASTLHPESGQGFYAVLSHGLMVAVFVPAFLLPLLAIAVSLSRYWKATGGKAVGLRALWSAMAAAGRMRNLAGGHGKGCNFENEDAYSNLRRYLHQATMYGFLLCFASTAAATVLHYGLGLEAPYPLWSLPKFFGISGGVLLCVGTAGLAWLKTKADPGLDATKAWGGDMAFILLLFAVSATGLLLQASANAQWVSVWLPLHLGTVLSFFLLSPYSKMAHGFYRMAALLRNEASSHINS